MIQTALSMMSASHEKHLEYVMTVRDLTEEAEQHQAREKQLLKEGTALRVQRSRELFLEKPTHTLFDYLYEQKQITRVEAPPKRIERGVVDKDRSPSLDPRTNEQKKDYLEEYIIHLGEAQKVVNHVHYGSREAQAMDFTVCHFKNWVQKGLTQKDVAEVAELEGGRNNIQVHYGRAGVETLTKLRELARTTAS